MKTVLRALKKSQKQLAALIHAERRTRTSTPYGFVPGLAAKSEEYRYRHVVYCLLRGRTLQEIESRRIANPPDPETAAEKIFRGQLAYTWESLTERPFPAQEVWGGKALRFSQD